MITILNLLNKIKWDKRENQEDYKIGYWDRIENKIIQIPLADIEMSDKFSFVRHDEEGEEHNIPFHRIKMVWKKDEIVWERKQMKAGS